MHRMCSTPGPFGSVITMGVTPPPPPGLTIHTSRPKKNPTYRDIALSVCILADECWEKGIVGERLLNIVARGYEMMSSILADQ